MAKGSSKGTGGGGGGLANMAMNTAPGGSVIRSYTQALNSNTRWTQQQRTDLATALQGMTGVGDKFTIKGNNTSNKVTFTKTGKNSWSDGENKLTSSELRDVMMELRNRGKWSFRAKS